MASGWTTDPSTIDAELINTVRYVIDRDKLTEFMTAQGYGGLVDLDPQTYVKLWMRAAGIDEIPGEGNYATVHDYYGLVRFTDTGATASFVRNREYRVSHPASYLMLYKGVSGDGEHFSASQTTLAGGTLTYRNLIEGAVRYRDGAMTNSYTLVVEDELPACSDGEPTNLRVGGYDNTDVTYHLVSTVVTPPEGEPCYHDGPGHTPGKITWTFEITGKNPAAQNHTFGLTTLYDVKLLDVIEPDTSFSTGSDAALTLQGGDPDVASALAKSSEKNVSITVVPGSPEVFSTKQVKEQLVRTGQDVHWMLTITNEGTGDSGEGEWIDIFPHAGGSRGSTMESAYSDDMLRLSNIRLGTLEWGTVADAIDAPTGIEWRIAVTTADPSTIVADAQDPSNQPGGSTEWC